MKRTLTLLTYIAMSNFSLATTLSPIQLLNPIGSASGQAIISAGASAAPSWGNVSAAALTGIVPVANGGTNASSASGTALDNISGFSSTGFLTRTGAGAYAFQSLTNGITYGNLAQASANTVLGNSTGATGNITAITVTGCNGSAQALQWTNGSGFGCNSGIATSGANANITSLSGLTTALSVSQGGTGLATITSHAILSGNGTSAISQIGAGTTGQMLIGVTGGFPAFGNTISTLTVTGSITPSSTAGIVGTTTNDNANAGSVGEFPTPTNLSSVSLTSGTAANGSSVSLTAGDWDVSGSCLFSSAASTTTTIYTCGISTTSATRPASFSQENVLQLSTAQTNVGSQMSTPVVRISVASTTTVYLVGMCAFGTSTETLSGNMRARRIR